MFKRTWIMILGILALGMVVSACGGGDLAEDLTPIPTLPPGDEPALIEAVQTTPEATAAPGESGGAEMSQDELVALGEEVFSQCESCHGEQDGAGPAFVGMADRAATRVEGMSAEEYIHESIVDPSAYVVEGFNDIMPKNYAESLSDQEIDAVVAYIMAESRTEAAPAEEATQAPEATEEATATEAPAEGEAEAEATEAPTAEGEGEAASVEGDPANGETLFNQNCSSCHAAEDGVGPAFTGMADRAATRVDGMSAQEYIHESIVDPSAYVVDGFQNIMPPNYGDQFSEQDLQDIIAYIMAES